MLDPNNITPGQEQYEMFNAPGRAGKPGPERCQYDYRHTDGEFFSCVAVSLEAARAKKDEWLKARSKP
jgi:hypothetical protein